MPIRVYDIAKKLGIESKQVLAIAKELGIKEAKVPSSSLDKITAEFLEEKLGPLKPAELVAPVMPEAPIVIIKEPEASSVDPLAPVGSRPDVTSATPPITKPSQFIEGTDVHESGCQGDRPGYEQQHGAPEHNPAPHSPDPRLALPATAQVIKMKPPIIVRDLAEQMIRKPFQLIADLMQMGIFVDGTAAISTPVAIKLCAKLGIRFQLDTVTDFEPAFPTQPLSCEPQSQTSPASELVVTVQLAGSGAKDFMERVQSGKIHFSLGLDLPSSRPGAKKILLSLASQSLRGSREQKQQLAERSLTMEDAAKLRTAYGAASELEGSEFVTLARFGDTLKQLHPEFHPDQYGKRSLSEFVKAQGELFEVQENRKLTPTVLLIRLKDSFARLPEADPTTTNPPETSCSQILIGEMIALIQDEMEESWDGYHCRSIFAFLNQMNGLLMGARVAALKPISEEQNDIDIRRVYDSLSAVQTLIFEELASMESLEHISPFLIEMHELVRRALATEPEWKTPMSRRSGKIQHLKSGQNYGFILESGTEGQEFFFHASGLKGGAFCDLEVGDHVNFEVETTERGIQAFKVFRAGARYKKESSALGYRSDRY